MRFTNDINSIFFPLKFSVFLFSNRRAMGSHILHSSIGLEGYKCAAVEIYVIPCYERFVKIWNLASFVTRKSLWCVFMKASMRSNWPGIKNCCWGQVLTEAWILLWCIVCLRFTNDINSIFFPLKFSVFLFSNRRAMASHILHSSIGLDGYKCAAADIYVIPCYERFVKIWNLASFFTRKSLWCVFMKASMR